MASQISLSNAPTLTEVAQCYLNNVVKGNYADSTYRSYKTRLENHILPVLGARLVTDLKKLEVQRFVFSLNVQDPPLSANTVRLVKSILNGVLDFAVDLEIVGRNVSDRVKLPKREKYQPRVYTNTEVQKLLEVSKGTTLFLPILLAVAAGLRRSEILALQKRDIDFKNGIIKVTKTMVDHTLLRPKTSCSHRYLQPSNQLMSALKEHLESQQTLAVADGHAFVIAKKDGSPYNPSYISRAFGELLEKNNLPATRFHDLRHTYATHAHYNGMPTKDLSASMGHQLAETTLENYVHREGGGKPISITFNVASYL